MSAYDVFVPIHPRDSLTSTRDVIARALSESDELESAPELTVEGPESDHLIVRLRVEAADEGSAVDRARSIVDDALTAAAVRSDSLTIGEVEARPAEDA
ncbi:MAG: hypothetical protein QOE01_2014 [Actinomycetota bacterium]|nr:hypothetical protein [Actinomycetota bacterium]